MAREETPVASLEHGSITERSVCWAGLPFTFPSSILGSLVSVDSLWKDPIALYVVQ